MPFVEAKHSCVAFLKPSYAKSVKLEIEVIRRAGLSVLIDGYLLARVL